jgi:putative glutamine amidotransferase
MSRPKILLSTNTVNISELKSVTGDTHILYSDVATASAIVETGGLPYFIPSLKELAQDEINSYLDNADGIVLTGEDAAVNPLYYGESPLTSIEERIDDDRDRLDIHLIKEAHKRNIPILGICKGSEIINVALGGTLYQSIKDQSLNSINHQVKKADRGNLTHKLNVEKNTLIHSIFKQDIINVNGGHKQGIKQLADVLKASSYAEDKLIETFEQKEGSFILGVQFHPELRLFDTPYKKIFQVFIDYAK